MNKRWLAYLSLAALGIIVLLLFSLRLRPAWVPPKDTTSGIVAAQVPTVTFADPSVGPVNAKVTIVEFGDFQCGPCALASDVALSVQHAFPNDVRVAWKHLPNTSIHPVAEKAAIAAQCAQRQGLFWPYAAALFARQTVLAEDQFAQVAQEVKLNTKAFAACYANADTLALVKKDVEEALGLSVSATPTLFVNGQRFVGAVSLEELTAYVKTLLVP